MVCFVVKSPLTEDQIGSRIFDSLNHVCEVVLLHGKKFVVLFGSLDLETMLSLWLGWLKWASEDADLGVFDLLLHLWV